MADVNIGSYHGAVEHNPVESRRIPGKMTSANLTALNIEITAIKPRGPPELESRELSHDDYHLREEDVQSVLGVSIGREQTRLMSPTTPAAEKAAAMQGMTGWSFYNDTEDEEQEEVTQVTLQHPLRDNGPEPFPSPKEPPPTLGHLTPPSPWTAGPKTFEQVDPQRYSRQSSPNNRSRASTGPTSVLADLNIKRFWTSFSLSGLGDHSFFKDLSLPKLPSMGGALKEADTIPHDTNRSRRSNSLFVPKFPWTGPTSSVRPQRSRDASPDTRGRNRDVQAGEISDHSASRPVPLRLHLSDDSRLQSKCTRESNTTDGQHSTSMSLRRSASDQSLPLRSAMSRVSSLGDDSRWDNVQGQVNSRMKAIKDSFQDSALRLPSLPNISFSSLRPDFTHRRVPSTSTPPNGVTNGPFCQGPLEAGTLSSRMQESIPPLAPAPSQKPHKPSHHYLDLALAQLTGDVVIMGGYRGSILRSAEPPHRQVWVPVKAGLNIRKVNLEVGLDVQDEEKMEDSIFASGMLTHIGPVDISRRLLKRLKHCSNTREGKLRVHDYGYDWRLSPHLLAKNFQGFLQRLQCNRVDTSASERGATIIAHSLGGLIVRYVVNQQPDLFAGVLYAGVPQHCVNILGPFRNGDEVLLSSKVLTAQVNFTLRTSFALLPESGQCFLDKITGEQYHVNFFNVESWKEYAFSPCVAMCLPALSQPERRSLLGSVSGTFPSLGSKKGNGAATPPTNSVSDVVDTAVNTVENASNPENMQMGPSSQVQTSCTIPLSDAMAYLRRTLSETLTFKRELAFNSNHARSNGYPPLSIMYSTSVPTVYGARVAGRDGIKRADAYDNLAFASGDGVVLARAAMLPRGYTVVEGGKVRTERGHVGLLGDLEGVGKCLLAIALARKRGVGLGMEPNS